MESFLKKYWRLLLLSILIYLIGFVWILPEQYVYFHFKFPQDKEKLYAIKDIRGIFVQIGAGILAIIGIYLTWKRTNALDEQNKINLLKIENDKETAENTLKELQEKNKHDKEVAEKNLKELQEKNRQDREKDEKNLILQQFSKATELLKDDNIASRLSGIFLFEKIMNESIDYHWQIIEILTEYLSEKRDIKNYNVDFVKDPDRLKIEIDERTKTKTYIVAESYLKNKDDNGNEIGDDIICNIKLYYRVPVEKDIQAIISILGRRNMKYEYDIESGENLEELLKNYRELINKRNIEIDENEENLISEKKSYEEIFKSFNDINSKKLKQIKEKIEKIKKINLTNLNLYKANLNNCHFENVDFSNSHLQNSNCERTSFNFSNFTHSHFNFAECWGAYFHFTECEGTHFIYAKCQFINFEHAIINKCHFEYSICQHPKFNNVHSKESDFFMSILDDGYFINSTFIKNNFENADCGWNNFYYIKFDDSNFKNADCNLTSFFNSSIKDCNFEKAILSNTSFEKINKINAKQLSNAETLYKVNGITNKMKKSILKLNPTIFNNPYGNQDDNEFDNEFDNESDNEFDNESDNEFYTHKEYV